MIIVNARDNVLLEQLNHMEKFADHVRPVAVLYNEDDSIQITDEIKQRYPTLETPIIRSCNFIILERGDLSNGERY